ncbi:MAG: 50S ribosomal protein L4 [Candidatus Kapabacteria bacterium]|jgi:large subunit ribosomal protein L4|nr:50S ribosomal protein L4 [Candidatus Kapabacteria bacterium]
MLLDIFKIDGSKSGQVEMNDAIFGIDPNEHAMHMAVVAYLAHQRQGTAKTKTRSEVRGGGRKPWRQKGRGTARAGTIRSPLWAGGGTIHGPVPHKYTIDLPKKVKRLARKSAFSTRISENNIKIVEDFTFDEIKTKQMTEVLKSLELSGEKTLILVPKVDEKVYISARNIPNVKVAPADLASTYDILNHKKILILKSSIDTIDKTFSL